MHFIHSKPQSHARHAFSTAIGVPTKTLVQAIIKRNIYRFPPDFMFQLTAEEFENLRSQLVTLKSGGRR